MNLRGFLIVIACRASNIKTAAAFANLLARKKGALFSLIHFFGSLGVQWNLDLTNLKVLGITNY